MTASRSPRRSPFERLLMMLGWTDLRISKRRDRIALSRLTDEQLRDIGLSRRQIDGGYVDAWIDRLDSSRHR